MPDTTYRYGKNRVVYQASDFSTGLAVTARLWKPGLTEDDSSPFTLTELGYGLYYFEYNFRNLAPYHAVFFEGSTAAAYHTFRIRTKPW